MTSMHYLPLSIILVGITATPHIAAASRLTHLAHHRNNRPKAQNNLSDLAFPEDPLPSSFQGLLAKGKIWNLLVLATVYENNKYGKTVQNQDTVQIRSPFTKQTSPAWNSTPTFLSKLGNKNAVVYIWKGSGNDRTIYVTFTPARDGSYSLFHINQIIFQSKPLDSEVDGITMSSYVKRKFDGLWFDGPKGGLKTNLTNLLNAPEYKGYTVLFGGLSLGATLAQIAAYRFIRDFNWPNFYAITWNGFLWTTAEGVQKVADTLGNRMLTIMMTQRSHKTLKRYWDPVGSYSFKNGYANMVHVRLLEAGCNRQKKKQAPGDEQICGTFLRCSQQDSCPGTYGHKFRHIRKFLMQMLKLHHAPMALAGTKEATCTAFETNRKN